MPAYRCGIGSRDNVTGAERLLHSDIPLIGARQLQIRIADMEIAGHRRSCADRRRRSLLRRQWERDEEIIFCNTRKFVGGAGKRSVPQIVEEPKSSTKNGLPCRFLCELEAQADSWRYIPI